MKSSILAFLVLGHVAAFATTNENTSICARLLGIPNQFYPQFEKYVRPEYLPHLHRVELTVPETGWLHFRVYAPRASELVLVDFGIKLDGYFEDKRRTHLTWNDIEISETLPQELCWRIAWAHILNEYRTIRTVEWMVYHGAEECIVQQALIEGLSPEEAVKRTNFYRALSAYGFEIASVKAQLMPLSDGLIAGDTSVTVRMTRPARGRSKP